MKKTIIIVLFFCLCLPALATKPSLKSGLSYELTREQKIPLTITQIPKKYPWIERDLDGRVLSPAENTIIIAENTSDLILKGPFGKTFVLPRGSKFYAKVLDKTPAKSFWRKEKLKLGFYQLAIPQDGFTEFEVDDSLEKYDGKHSVHNSHHFKAASEVDLLGQGVSYKANGKNKIKNLMNNVGDAAGYTIAGALAAPFALYAISSGLGSLLSFSAITNPYVLGGAAAIGGGLGLAYGISKKGNRVKLEPGERIEISLNDTWLISNQIEKLQEEGKINRTATIDKRESDYFKLKILEVKKTKDVFNDTCIRVKLAYNNLTHEELRYNSFQLVDSMGKAYEPSPSSIKEDYFDGLPDQGTLNLYFAVDFPKAEHQLKVLNLYNQKAFALANIQLGK